jgi:glycerophosphoryl diester phosphodiesterase
MKKCREFGLDVNVWTVNRDEWLKMCCDFGVHAIITNYPDKARKIIDG